MRIESNIYFSKNDSVQVFDIIDSKIRENFETIKEKGEFEFDFTVGLYHLSAILHTPEYLHQRMKILPKDLGSFVFKRERESDPSVIHIGVVANPTEKLPFLKKTSFVFDYFCDEDNDRKNGSDIDLSTNFMGIQLFSIAEHNFKKNNKDFYTIETFSMENDDYQSITKQDVSDAINRIFAKCDVKIEYTDSSFVFLLKIGDDVLIDIQYKGVVNISRAEIKEVVDSAVSHIFYNYDVFDDFRY